MNNYFCQINTDFINDPSVDWAMFKNEKNINFQSNDVNLTYFSIKDFSNFANQFNPFPDCDSIEYVTMTGQGILYPHKDINTRVCLNYYINTSNDPTKFFTLVPPATDKNYQAEDLIFEGEFIAQSGQAFLLNVSEMHGVVKQDNITRTFLCFQWNNLSFEEVALRYHM